MTNEEKINLFNRNKRIIEIVMKQIKEKCPDSIDMVAVGGSFCNGDIYEKSDLDLVIISRDEKAKCLDKCFILGDVAMDIYTHDWTSFERMADYPNPYVTKLLDLDIIYTHDDSVLEHYQRLQAKLKESMNNDSLIRANIQTHFNLVMSNLTKLNNVDNDLGLAYRLLGHLIKDIEFIIYMLNKSYIKRGTKRIPEEIISMEVLPTNFKELYLDIVNVKSVAEIKEKANKLGETLKVFLNQMGFVHEVIEEKEEKSEKKPIEAISLIGTYEEIYSNWKNKMLHAVTINSRYLSFDTMCSCQGFYDEMADMFDIPRIDLISHYNPDDLMSNVTIFNACMQEWLKLYERFGIEVNYYPSLIELEDLYGKSENDKTIV